MVNTYKCRLDKLRVMFKYKAGLRDIGNCSIIV